MLQKIGTFGFLVLKDFGSILSMRAETKAELLAALREIYDGKWTRVIGADGGRTLQWSGKIGLLFGCTRVYDSYYGVISELGDRFLLCRMEPDKKQFLHAIKHANRATQMRARLVEAVTNLFAAPLPPPRDISDREINWLNDILQIAVRLRGAVKRDYRTRELEDIYGAEGTARFGKALERVLAGLDCLGVKRSKARKVDPGYRLRQRAAQPAECLSLPEGAERQAGRHHDHRQGRQAADDHCPPRAGRTGDLRPGRAKPARARQGRPVASSLTATRNVQYR